MTEHQSLFCYVPLSAGEIRLLSSSFSRDGTIVWSLNTVPLRDENGLPTGIQYDALSYTWGDQSSTFSLTCNGQELKVHHNLYHALPHLARRDSNLPIWIDAVCINQTDSGEKMTQINMMSKIYEEATQVWVWLGVGLGHTSEVLDLLPKLKTLKEEMDLLPGNPKPTLESMGYPPLSSSFWSAMLDLIDNSWFRRLWIFQEAALARAIRVLYAGREIDWETLVSAVKAGVALRIELYDRTSKKPARCHPANEAVFGVRHLAQHPWYSSEERRTQLLVQVSNQMTDIFCFDPRDRVFGMLGFFSENQITQLGHIEHLPLEQLYAKFAHHLYCNLSITSIHWWILFNRSCSAYKRPGLPSWCPDFHQVRQDVERADMWIATGVTGLHNAYCASQRQGISLLDPSNSNQLTLRGQILDKIGELYPELRVDLRMEASVKENMELIGRVWAWEKSVAQSIFGLRAFPLPSDPAAFLADTPGCNVPFSMDDYWRALLGDRINTGKQEFTYQMFLQMRKGLDAMGRLLEICRSTKVKASNNSLLDELHLGNTSLGEEDMDITPELYAECEKLGHDLQYANIGQEVEHGMLHFIINWQNYNRSFRTCNGWFGFGGLDMRKDDLVVVFNHSEIYHVLRLTSGGAYNLVGRAIVHGMMKGEIEELHREEMDFILV